MMRALLCLGLAVVSAGASAEDLGRLFFSPEQRQALDARRKARVPDKPATALVASPIMRLDGYVKRSAGRSTVWVNGEPAEDVSRLPGSTDGRVDVTVGDSGARVGLKPGETLDRGNNEVRDVIGDGEIRVRSRTP